MNCNNCDDVNSINGLCSCKETVAYCKNCIDKYKCRVCGCFPCIFCICYDKCEQCSEIGYVCCQNCDTEFRNMCCDELDVSCSKCSNTISIIRKR